MRKLIAGAALVVAGLSIGGVATAKSPFAVPPHGPPMGITPPAGPFVTPPAPSVTITFIDYGCDLGGGSASEMLYVWLGRSAEQAGMTFQVNGGATQLWDEHILEAINDIAVSWPATNNPTPLNPQWDASFVITVRDGGGTVVYTDTFTIERLLIEQPLCAPLFSN